MLEKIKKKLLISLAVAGILYLGFTIYADFNEVALAFLHFNWLLLPLLLILSLINYYIRFLKWDYYLALLKVPIKKIDSLSIFMSGLIMSITPGKFGEVLKSYLVKQINGTPLSKTAPIIFVERITDSISLMLIVIAGAYVYNYGRAVAIGFSIFFVILIGIITNRKIAEPFLSYFEKVKFLNKYIAHMHSLYESSYLMLQPAPLLKMTLLSLFSWFFECFGYYIILINFNVDVNLLWASFSYAFATVIGAVSMLPGGLGVTEGSLTLFLIQENYPKDVAVASTFIVRVVTLWFAVLVGIISVSFYQHRFGKVTLPNGRQA
ncbi:MAG: lysylphosphatidylglycerol synthase transmembrane domain-containing protein [Ignavibacteriaceae bacterium]